EQFARKIFCDLWQSIIRHEAGALAGEILAVHDMRVGIRRLRVALDNFATCLSKKDRKRLRASLKNLAEALGGVRDLDVLIDALKSKQANRPDEDRAAIGSLISRLRAWRRRRLRKLVSYLQSEEYANFKREFQAGGENEIVCSSGTEELQNEQAA